MAENCAYAQGAKIHRKIAHLVVHPYLVIQEPLFAITIHVFEMDRQFRVNLYHGSQELLSRHPVVCSGSICSLPLSLPAGLRGKIHVVLEMKKEDFWTPVAEEYIVLLPHFYSEIDALKRRAEAVEERAMQNPRSDLLQAAWSVLAFQEDLLERARFGETRGAFIVEQKMHALRTKVDKLEAGLNPYDGVTGYQLRGYRSDVNGEIQIYSLYVPKQYEASKSWPFVVMLHGAYSNHHLAMRRVMGKSNRPGENDAAAKRNMPPLPDVPYLVACPNGYETLSYEGFAEQDIWRVMDEVAKGFSVDADRVYLTGLSMGAAGTAKLGFRKPDRFAALAMVCGFFDPLTMDPKFFEKPLFSRRLEDVSATHPISDNILHVPIKLCHGKNDSIVPVEGTKKLHDRLTKIGFHSELEIYPDVDHEAWEPAYRDARIFDWFSQFTRVNHPREVRYKCGDSEGGGAYWLHIDELKEIRRYGTVKAEAKEDAVYVDSKNVQRLTLTVPSSFYPEGQPVRILINQNEVFHAPLTGEALSFVTIGKEWARTREPFVHRLMPGGAGIDTVFNDRQVFVHESSGTEASFNEARKLAVQRSIPWFWSDVRWEVIPEDHLTESIHANNNLVFFGSLPGSTFLQKHLAAFPFQLQDKQIQFAERIIEPTESLTMIYPNPENPSRYVLINTSCTLEGLKGLRDFSIARRSLLLESDGDFVVWSPEGKKRWGGLFDKNWAVEIKTVKEYS